MITGVQGPSPCGQVLVKKGDRVVAGQALFGPRSWTEEPSVVPVHSPVSGKVVDVRPAFTAGGEIAAAVTVEADGLDERAEPLARPWDPLRPDEWPPGELRRFMRMAGVDGTPGPGGDLYGTLAGGLAGGVVVINAVGCEPGLPADMLQAAADPEALLLGAAALRRAGGADRALVVVQLGSPADAALTRAIEDAGGVRQALAGVELVRLPDVDWVWVPLLLAREAVARSGPGKGRAATRQAETPLLVESAATAVDIGTALLEGRPVTRRLVTVSTPGRVRAVRVPIGTPVSALLDGALEADGKAPSPLLLLAGGPLQGSPLPDLQAPVTKAVSAITAMRQKVRFRPEAPCIRCGRCAQVCPAGLLPLYIARAAGAGQMDEARALGAAACVECAACTVVCPSYRPLLQWIRLAKHGRARRPARGGVA